MSKRERSPAIIGIGQTDFSRNSGRSEWQLAIEAIGAALRDANVDPSAVDGIVRYQYDNVHEGMIARSLDAKVTFHAQVGFGGQATAAVLRQAANAIKCGQARIVVCYRSLNVRSGVRYGRAERSIQEDTHGNFVAQGPGIPSGAQVGPHGLLAPGQVLALWARRYMYEYGIDGDDLANALATVAVRQREYANQNPAAIMKDRKLDRDEYFASRMISTPLRLFDYCLESDGAAAFIIADANEFKDGMPVNITATSQYLPPYGEAVALLGTAQNGADHRAVSQKLFSEAGMKPQDLDVAMLYDATSLGVPMGMETYGISAPGEAVRDINDRGFGFDTKPFVNTSGGHLSEAYVHGANHILEAVRQLRGTSANQVDAARSALVACSSNSAAILEV